MMETTAPRLDVIKMKREGQTERFHVEPKISERIENILEMRDTIVREIMVPRVDMNAIDINQPFSGVLKKLLEFENSRVPVYDKDIDNIIGVLYVKDLMKYYSKRINKTQLIKIIRKPFFVTEDRLINDLLLEFKRKRIHLAIVTEEMGGTAGLVTLEDIIEEIVGDIQDEYDSTAPLYEQINKNRLRADARMPIDDLEELFELKMPDEDCDTVGGLVFHLFSRVPKKGERITYKNVTFKVESIKKNQIRKIILEKSK
jgi:CBS domain containing-hemolysin-like protein